jgi:Domain of unknown function (DUF6285)
VIMTPGLPSVPSDHADESPAPAASGTGSHPGGWRPHDAPTAAELLDAVREFLESDVLPAVEGRVRFHVRVAANVVSMVARELTLGPRQAEEHLQRLARLGVSDEAGLAEAIRSGALDDRLDEVRAVVRATVADKLAVANPRYLGDLAHAAPEAAPDRTRRDG